MIDWFQVWERKGREPIRDLRTLDGFENTVIDARAVAGQIAALLDFRPGDSVLEVGCGAGMLAQYLDCDYTGVDYSAAMVSKFLELQTGKRAEVGPANRLRFADRSFDLAFAFSVFQYFPDAGYADQAIAELKRVARRAVFIGDLPERSHSPDHRLYRRQDFAGWRLLPGFYNPDRFNVLLELR